MTADKDLDEKMIEKYTPELALHEEIQEYRLGLVSKRDFLMARVKYLQDMQSEAIKEIDEINESLDGL